MPIASPNRSCLRLAAALFVGVGLALAVADFGVYFRAPLLESGDGAVNALQIDNARHLTELYGNYSRFEINHPGPAFFYVYAAGELFFHDLLHLTPGPDNAHLLTSMLLQSFFFALAIAILSMHLPWRALPPMALVAAALYFGALREPFVSMWPPHVLLMPSLCFLAACVSVASGRIEHLLIAVVAGGFLFHGHVAQVLFVGPLGGAAVCLGLRRVRAPGAGSSWREIAARYRAIWWAGSGLVGLFLLPLAIDMVTRGRQSNVAAILGRFYANTGDTKSALQSFLYFLSFATATQDQAAIFTKLGPTTTAFFAAHALRIAAWGLVFLVPPVFAFLSRRRFAAEERRFFALAYGFLAATVLLCVLWGKAQAGPMENFNGYFYYGVYYFSLVLLLGLISRNVAPVFPPVIAGIAGLAALVVFALSLHREPPPEATNGEPIRRAVEAVLRDDSDRRPKLLVFEHYAWPTVAAAALELQRRGVTFYTAPWWSFMFEARHEMPPADLAPEDHAEVWWMTLPGPGGTLLATDLDIFTEPAPLRPDGGEIRFRGRDNGFRYVVYGLSVGNVDFAWSDLPRVVLLFRPLPATHEVRVVFDAQAAAARAGAPPGQPADVYFDGEMVGRVVAGPRADLSVTVPAALWNRQPRAKLELRFPSAAPSRSHKRPAYQSWSAWGLWKIRFEQGL